jgi:hypothetical protein
MIRSRWYAIVNMEETWSSQTECSLSKDLVDWASSRWRARTAKKLFVIS